MFETIENVIRMLYTICNEHLLWVCVGCFVVITIIQHSSEMFYFLCKIWYLLIYSYKDRLTRFGFYYLETVFLAHGVNIIVVKDISTEKSVQEELVEDMMSLISSFSGKLYGMRSRKKKAENLER